MCCNFLFIANGVWLLRSEELLTFLAHNNWFSIVYKRRALRFSGGVGVDRCAPLDVEQFQPATTTELSGSDNNYKDEVNAVVELNDETGAFEYTLYSLTSPPKIKLYVPGTMLPLSVKRSESANLIKDVCFILCII